MTDTKNTMKNDMKLAKAKTLLARAGVDADKTLKQLVAKYGANTYDIVLNSLLKPSDMMLAAGQKYANSRKTIEYYASHQVSDTQLAKAIKKTQNEVAKRKTQKGTPSTTNKNERTKATVKRDRFNNRVSNRTPSRPSRTSTLNLNNQKKNNTQKKPVVRTTPSAKKTPVATPTPATNNSGIVVPTMPWNSKGTDGNTSWGKPITPASTPANTAEDAYNKSFGARVSGEVSLEELMKETGVTQADIQAVFQRNPKIVQEMGGGKTNKALARSAARVDGSCEGGCLGGVQMIFAGVSKEKADIISAQKGAWPKKISQAGNSNSACNTYIPLERSGQFITLTYPNKAYHKSENSKEAAEMKAFNKKLPAGTTVCIDNDIPDGYRGKVENKSKLHGHTWIQDLNGASCSDGRQVDGPKFSNYGKNMHISIAKDNYIPKELAIELIKQKQAREAAALAKAKQNQGRA